MGKKYDIFTFFNELELLDIRFSILNDYVDYFVVIECNETFSGVPKELFFENNKDLFKKYEHKIIHIITDDVPRDFTDANNRLETEESELKRTIIQQSLISPNVPPGMVHWLKEFYQKELIKRAFEGMNDDDLCFISDLDEIWNPEVNMNFNANEIFKLRQISYCYYLNNRSNEPWDGTLVAKYGMLKDKCLNHLRSNCKIRLNYVDGGGWHFTNIGGADQIRKKLESYGHQEFNNDLIKSQIENRIEKNEDFLGRVNYKFWLDESELPVYIKENKEKYHHLFKV